jgi:prepilin-type processing-associated H-X9-DG protein
LAVVVKHWDGDVLSGATLDEIKKVLTEGDESNLEPLLKRIDLLEKTGDAYVEDFALWWSTRGRLDVGSKVLWRRDLLKQGLEKAFNRDEEAAYALIRQAADSGDPVAMLWQFVLDREQFGSRERTNMGNFTKLVSDARELANAGDPEAAFFMGMMSMEGMGREYGMVDATPEQALAWLETAAESGNPMAIEQIAEAYRRGRRGVEKDLSKAKYWEDRLEEISPGKRSASVRASSANNLKQMGLSMKMFANESRGEKYPRLSAELGQLAINAEQIYPEYLSDTKVYISPAHPSPSSVDNVDDPRATIRDHSYWYLGYMVADEKTGLAFVDHFRKQAQQGLTLSDDLQIGNETIFQLRDGIERFLITDINNPGASAMAQSSVPIMIERPGLHEEGGNVLYLDGHVEFIRYPGKYPMTERFIGALESLDQLK